MRNLELFKEFDWEKEWLNMPEFFPPTRNTKLRNSYNIDDVIKINKKPTEIMPKYPIYIISKGRWDSRLTVKSLDKLKIPYKIVIEPQELEQYSSVIDKNKILVLPFSNLGQGSIPARNWVLDHSISMGNKKHWILDDNISGFGTQKHGRRVDTACGDFFYYCENFVDRYENILISGIRYRFHHNYVKSPYLLNTRIYSCILIDNKITHRWRGKYNEDTDLCLRVLKDGFCTLLFTWCYCNKMATLKMNGGNTEELYKNNGRLLMAESLLRQHPDVVRIIQMWGRPQHFVDYGKFKKNKLIKNMMRTPVHLSNGQALADEKAKEGDAHGT